MTSRHRGFVHLLPLAVVIILLAGVCEAKTAKGRPPAKPAHKGIAVRPDAFTERDFQQVRLKYYRKLMGDAYRKFGIRNPAWDEAALGLLEGCEHCIAVPHDWQAYHRLLAAVEPLMTSGCEDPLVCCCVAMALIENGRMPDGEPYLRRAIEGYQNVPYSRAIAWSGPLRLAGLCRSLGGEKLAEVAKWEALSIKWLGQATGEKIFADREQRVLWGELSRALDGQLDPRITQVHEAIQHQPGADPWLANMMAGVFYIDEAWKARGTGFAAWERNISWVVDADGSLAPWLRRAAPAVPLPRTASYGSPAVEGPQRPQTFSLREILVPMSRIELPRGETLDSRQHRCR